MSSLLSYWCVQDTNPSTQVFHIDSATFVADSDATYQAWLAVQIGYDTIFSDILGTADNGSGLIRLTLNNTGQMVTGLVLNVIQVGGTTEANGLWTVTVIDGTHIDLQGSTYTNAYTSGGRVHGPGVAPTAAGLYTYIDQYNRSLAQYTGFWGSTTLSAGATLTNPMTGYYVCSFASDQNVTFPQMNIPGALPIGFPVIFKNASVTSVATIKQNDGTTLLVLYPEQVGLFWLEGNTTVSGAWNSTFIEQLKAGSTSAAGVLLPPAGGTGIANNSASTITISGSFATTFVVAGANSYTFPNASDTLVTLTATQELDNKTLDSSVGKGTWTASGTWTLPAHTLGGTVSGGGNQINNVIIGTSTPLAGSFTTLAASSTITGSSTVAAAATSGFLLGANTALIQAPTSSYHKIQGPDGQVNALMGSSADKREIHTAETAVQYNTGNMYVYSFNGSTIGATFSENGITSGATTAAGAGCVLATNFFRSTGGFLRVATQFDKTSSAVLSNITGLSATVVAGKTYMFEAILYTSANASGGVQFSISGTATATAVNYEGILYDTAAIAAQTRATALGTALCASNVTAGYCRITGTIVVNAGGTLTVQFAQNGSFGTASSVLVGSTFRVFQVA